MEQRLSVVTLGVSDLRRARTFYTALGWRESGDPDADVAFFQAAGMVLALGAAPRSPRTVGLRTRRAGAVSPSPTTSARRTRSTR